jgi:hypothetical protein
MTQQTTQANAAKYAFFYLLSLVALIFVSTAVGAIVFQIINKYIPDVLTNYSGSFTPEALKYGISALIIATPLYYFLAILIHKSLFKGILDKDSAVRRWLTYFVLLVTSVVMIGWFISIINTFLDGDLTLKFALKALTAIIIAAIIFAYYLYDIRREEVLGKADKLIQVFLFGSLIIIIASFIFSLFVVQSPAEARRVKLDQAIVNSFSVIDGNINRYYTEYNKLPASLELLKSEYNEISDKDLVDPVTGKKYDYKAVSDLKYEICAEFKASTSDLPNYYYDQRWSHQAGYQCLTQKVYVSGDNIKAIPESPAATVK